ncbi:hypothetical protein [Radiobacillus sp. PE A8.2]
MDSFIESLDPDESFYRLAINIDNITNLTNVLAELIEEKLIGV